MPFFLSLGRHRAAVFFLLVILIFIGAGSARAEHSASGRPGQKHGGRPGVVLCGSADHYYVCPPRKPAPPKPNPEKENRSYTEAALHAVFAKEEKKYGAGLAVYLNNTNGAPYQLALSTMRSLRRENEAANAKSLEAKLTNFKQAFVESTGLKEWFAAFTLPKITSFSPDTAIPEDEIVIKGENLGETVEVKFLKAKAPFTVVSHNELKVKVPQYIGGIRFPIEVTTKYGSAKSSSDFIQLSGGCTDRKIPIAMWELNLRLPRGDGATGECDPALYGNYQSYAELIKAMAEKKGFIKREPPKITKICCRDAGSPGSKVEIEGKNLSQVKGVYFGNTPAKNYEGSYGAIIATVPESGGKISVETFSGTDVWPKEFRVVAPAVVESVGPSDVVRGDTIRITGKNFTDPLWVDAGEVIVRTPTELHVTTRNYILNTPVTVNTEGGKAVSPGTINIWLGLCRNKLIEQAIKELYNRKPLGTEDNGECDPNRYKEGRFNGLAELKVSMIQRYGGKVGQRPTISGVLPTTGSPGDWVTIHGANFNDLLTVMFGSDSAWEIQAKSVREIRARIRPVKGGSQANITVWTSYGSATYGYALAAPPTISTVQPKEALPGVAVRISGTGLEQVTRGVFFNDIPAEIQSRSDTVLVAVVPKGVAGKVAIKAATAQTTVSWEPFGIVTARLVAPEDTLRNLRIEIIGPDNKLRGSAALIGNAGAGLEGAILDKLIGNAGAGLIGNAGAGLIGNAGAGLSIDDLSSLIGNAGAGLIGNAGAGLIGNAGAGLQVSLGSLIGNAGAGLTDAQVKNLIGNAGAGLIGNAGAGLAGNAGSSLIGNAGAGLVDGALSLITRKPADLLLIDIKNLAGNAGSSLKLPIGIVQIAPPKIDLSVGVGVGLKRQVQGLKEIPVVDKYKIKPSESAGSVLPPAQPKKPETPKLVTPPVTETKLTPTPSLPKQIEPTPAPAIVPKVVTPPTPLPIPIPKPPTPAPEPVPVPNERETSCPTGFTYSFTFATCMEDAPQKLSPYDGLPCPENVDNIPSYTTRGCIPQ